MTINEVYERASGLMERMCELDQECTLLERRHAEVVAKMGEINEAMERLLRPVLDLDGEYDLW